MKYIYQDDLCIYSISNMENGNYMYRIKYRFMRYSVEWFDALRCFIENESKYFHVVIAVIVSVILFPFLLITSHMRPAFKREFPVEELPSYLSPQPFQKVES